MQRCRPEPTATLDMDATLCKTTKVEALWCYKGYKSYPPLNVWCAEQRMVVHSAFRDGNVPFGYEQLRVLQEALERLPEGVKTVRLRMATAGYEHALLQYCELGKNERFGRIEFAIGCDVTPEFKKGVERVPQAEWKPIYRNVGWVRRPTGQEWAEVCFVPDGMCNTEEGLLPFPRDPGTGCPAQPARDGAAASFSGAALLWPSIQAFWSGDQPAMRWRRRDPLAQGEVRQR